MGDTIEMAALGRPFNLGMLYDCRSDKLIPGITLWDYDDLKEDMRVLPKPNSEFNLVTSESISDKSSSLGAEASIKASFLGGLISVGGSAKYLKDTKTSKKQSRVTFQYKTTTQFKELTMNHLGRGNIKHPYVFDNGIATHVVTAILYGAQAFFVFDKQVSNSAESQTIEGKLRMVVNAIPGLLSIEGEGSLSLEEEDRQMCNGLSVTFYGDFNLEQSPTTFDDAIRVYRDLPKMLGPDQEYAVPVRVWLLPLTVLDSSAAKVVRDISLRLVQEAQNVLEDFSDLEVRCNDVLKSTAAQQFSQIAKKLKAFLALCSEFKLGFQGTLARKLPAIRGGGEEEGELAEILKEKGASPFNNNCMDQWMAGREKEACTLMSISNLLANTRIVPSENDLLQETFNSHKTVCFVFSSLGDTDPYLSALEDYLKGVQSDDFGPGAQHIEKEHWCSSKEVCDALRRKAKLFSDFAETNKDNEDIKFFVVGLPDENFSGSTVYVYEDGFQVSNNFEPPSKPHTVTVDNIEHNSVTLRFSAPAFGAETITGYRVEFCVSGEEEWHQTDTDAEAEEIIVTGLSPHTKYSFRVRAVTDVGAGPAAQVDDLIQTLPCGPPEELEVTSNFSEISVSWKKPTEVGQNVQILRYIVEHGETENEIEWTQEFSTSEDMVIFGLDPLAPYTIKVFCDCGDNGQSKDNTTVTRSRPTEHLIQSCEQISEDSEIPTIYKLPLLVGELGSSGCNKYVYGEDCQKEGRCIILAGSGGCGKTTLIDNMINYILGVKWTDLYRFKLTEEDQTSDVTVYQINHQDGFRVSYSLTIIDTPGFGDTKDMETDREITEQLFKLFSEDGVDHIHAICIVTKSASEKPTHQRYMLDSLFSIFGKDLSESICFLVTFADDKPSSSLQALADAALPCLEVEDGLPVHYKCNNSVLFASNQPSEDTSDKKDQWNMGMANIKSFLSNLDQTEAKSLELTCEVLKERKELEDLVENLEEQLNVGIALMKEIEDDSEETSEELHDEFNSRREEITELVKEVALHLENLTETALKSSPLQNPTFIDSLIVEKETEFEWEKHVQTLREIKIQAEIMDKVKRGVNLLPSMQEEEEVEGVEETDE